jgi:hypothetical protein
MPAPPIPAFFFASVVARMLLQKHAEAWHHRSPTRKYRHTLGGDGGELRSTRVRRNTRWRKGLSRLLAMWPLALAAARINNANLALAPIDLGDLGDLGNVAGNKGFGATGVGNVAGNTGFGAIGNGNNANYANYAKNAKLLKDGDVAPDARAKNSLKRSSQRTRRKTFVTKTNGSETGIALPRSLG